MRQTPALQCSIENQAHAANTPASWASAVRNIWFNRIESCLSVGH